MTHPDQDVLAAIALGEFVDADATAHVAHCVQCQDDMDANAEVVTLAREGRPLLVEPSASVWARIDADLDADPDADLAADLNATGAAVPAPNRGRAAGPRGEQRQPRKTGGALRWGVAAGVAGLLLGGIGMRLMQRDTQPSDFVVSRASLSTLDTKADRGEADLVRTGDGLSLRISAQPLQPQGGYLEVWLINKDLKRMVSVGVLPANRTQESFAVTQQLIDEGYVIVDVSREQFDDKPQHSGDSLVRGVLA